jgi:16S rRNA (uracil1498-N3)-methyltransferase
MQLFFNPDLSAASVGFALDREESRHVIKVLRKTEGDILFVTNGLGDLFTAEITLASDARCQLRIVSRKSFAARQPYLHLAVAPTKMNERYEWFLEKATEIGVSEITPVICAHSERTTVKKERLQKILHSALKQSNQYHLPRLNEAVPFSAFVKSAFDGVKLIAHCGETYKKSLKSTLKAGEHALVLIGPEGDFSKKEIDLAFANGYVPVSLGDTRLRTETAAVVACHSVRFINEK